MKDLLSESVVARLERLERSNRKWKVCSLMSLAGFALLGFVGAQTERAPKKITANEIVVVDGGGAPRISLAVTEGGPILTFSPKDGPPRLFMGLGGGADDNSSPFLNFRNEAGMPLLLMGLSLDVDEPVETPYFNMCDRSGLDKVALGLTEGDKPFLHFNDKRHNAKLLLGVGPEDKAFLISRDSKGNDLPDPFEKRASDVTPGNLSPDAPDVSTRPTSRP
jgi:hypothetical protein